MKKIFLPTYILSIIISWILLLIVLNIFSIIIHKKIIFIDVLPILILYTIGILIVTFLIYLLSIFIKKIRVIEDFIEKDLTYKLSKKIIESIINFRK